MTTKERKQLKHSLKTDIDSADIWIKMALIGKELGANEDEKSSKSREAIVYELERLKLVIRDNCYRYLAEIDDAITKIS